MKGPIAHLHLLSVCVYVCVRVCLREQALWTLCLHAIIIPASLAAPICPTQACLTVLRLVQNGAVKGATAAAAAKGALLPQSSTLAGRPDPAPQKPLKPAASSKAPWALPNSKPGTMPKIRALKRHRSDGLIADGRSKIPSLKEMYAFAPPVAGASRLARLDTRARMQTQQQALCSCEQACGKRAAA